MQYLILFQLFITLSKCETEQPDPLLSGTPITLQTFMYWPNATIPFFINPDHFDHEQAMAIMTSLSMFAFKTCLKFMPVMTAPSVGDHVMTFVNPQGVKRCRIQTRGHSNESPHTIQLGYDCLKSPEIDMIVMRALGLPFEHNRMSRDVFIDVMVENIEPGYIQLFTKDNILPPTLRAIPYDVNSVMHFGERDYSKNGHRTIIFKIPNMRPNKNGLSPSDIKKIEMIYGPECRKRDRAEKYTICQSFPGLARRKREIVEPLAKSLRVNPNITPPPEILAGKTKDLSNEKLQPVATVVADNSFDNVTGIKNIAKETDKLVELIYQLAVLVLNNARENYCNITGNTTSEFELETVKQNNQHSALDIIGNLKSITDFANKINDDVEKNPKKFCQNSDTLEAYQSQCKLDNDTRCSEIYRSPKSRSERISTEPKDAKNEIKHKDDKKETADEITTITLKLNRRKREATINASTAKYLESVEEVTSTDNAPKSSETVTEVTTTISTSITSEATNELTSNVTAPKSLETVKKATTVITPKLSEDVKPKRRFTKPKQVKAALRTVSEPSSEAVEEASTTVSTNSSEKTDFAESNLKDMIKAMRDERLKEIEKVNSTKSELISKDSKIKRNKTSPSRSKLKALKKQKLKKIHKANSNTKSSTEKDTIDSSGTETRRKKKLIEMQKVRTFPKFKDVKAEPFRRVSMETRFVGRNVQDSSEESDSESEISLQEDKKPTSVEVRNESESSKDSSENKEKSKTHKKKNHEKADETSETESESSSEERYQKKKTSMTKKGSILKAIAPKTVNLTELNKSFYAERRWPHGDLIYTIKELPDYDLEDLRARLAAVDNILTNKTCVRMREVDIEEADGFEDYIILDDSPDYITGRVGGKQNFGAIELFQGNHHRQHTAMMVMAMLGFYFEVSRHDRDKHIRVHNRHIRADKLHHFEKLGEEATFDLPYDYDSATHPAIMFWRRLGSRGISTVATYKYKDPRGAIMNTLGEHVKLLSDSDIIKINSVYGVKCFINDRASRSK